MSFDSLSISFTPPPTIPSALRPLSSTLTSNALAAPVTTPADTKAGKLLIQLSDLSATSDYLQSLILARLAGSGLSFSPSENPDLARALSALYPDAPIVTGISIEMYAHMVDADLGLMQLQSAIGNSSSIEPSAQNIADLSTATKSFETAMIESLSYKNNLAPLLRTLKGDQIIFANISEQMADYPAYAGTTSTLPAGLDVSVSIESVLENFIANQSNIYGQTFSLLSTASSVESDIESVTEFYLSATVAEVSLMISTFNSLKSLSHGPKLKNLAEDMTNFVFVALLSEVSASANVLDRMVNLAVNPLKESTSEASSLIRRSQSLAATIGYATTGGLRGMVQGSSCSATSSQTSHSSTVGNISSDKITNALIQVLGKTSTGLTAVLNHLDLATRFVDEKNRKFQDQLRAVARRRTSDQSARLELLCSLRNLEAMTSIAAGVISTTQRITGNAVSASPLQAISQVLSTFNSPGGSSFAITNNTVLVTPPSIFPVPAIVQNVLNAGGVGLVATRDLARMQQTL